MIYLTKGQKLADNPGMVVYDSTGYYNDGDSVICASVGLPEEPVCRYEAKFIKYGGLVYSISDPDELLAQVLALDPQSLFGKDSKQIAVDKMVDGIVPQESGIVDDKATTTPATIEDEDEKENNSQSTTTPTVITPTSTTTATTTVPTGGGTSTTTPQFQIPPIDPTSTTTPSFTLPDGGASTTSPDVIFPTDATSTVSTTTDAVITPPITPDPDVSNLVSTTTPAEAVIPEVPAENIVDSVASSTENI